MHWAWRGTIAVVVGMACVWLSHSAFGPEPISLILAHAYEATYDILEAIGVTRAQTVLLATQIIFDGLIPALIVMGTYGFLTWRYGPRPPDAPMPCRKCGYSLRGNVSGICPECGERI